MEIPLPYIECEECGKELKKEDIIAHPPETQRWICNDCIKNLKEGEY